MGIVEGLSLWSAANPVRTAGRFVRAQVPESVWFRPQITLPLIGAGKEMGGETISHVGCVAGTCCRPFWGYRIR